MKRIFCIEEQYPDAKATCVNQVELPIKDGWQYLDKWPLIHEYENEEEFKEELMRMLNNNTLISRVFIRDDETDGEIVNE